MAFDPDKFLAQKGQPQAAPPAPAAEPAKPQVTQPKGFNPNAFLKSKGVEPEKSFGEKVYDYGVAPAAVTAGEVLGAVGGGAAGTFMAPGPGTLVGAMGGGGLGGATAGALAEALRQKLFENGPMDTDKIKHEAVVNGILSTFLGPLAGAAKEATVVAKVAPAVIKSKPFKVAAGAIAGHAVSPWLHIAQGIPEFLGAMMAGGIKNEGKAAAETAVEKTAPALVDMFGNELKTAAPAAIPNQSLIERGGKAFGLPVFMGSNYLRD
jgi:hypothetical protein